MSMRLVLVKPPEGAVLSTAEVRARLDIGSAVSDEVIQAFVAAATQQIDGAYGSLGRALLTQTWRGSLPRFPCGPIRIPLPPLQQINSLSYVDAAGETFVLDASQYHVMEGPRASIVPTHGLGWPSAGHRHDSVSIEFVAGYGAGADVPEPIRSAIALQVRKLLQLAQRDASLTQRIVFGVSSRSWAADGGAAGAAALDVAVTSLLSTYRVYSA